RSCLRDAVEEFVVAGCAHAGECACPAFTWKGRRAYHQFMMVHFHLHLILKPALLNHRLRKANAATVSYSDKVCFHDYNVIISDRRVNPLSAAPNVSAEVSRA